MKRISLVEMNYFFKVMLKQESCTRLDSLHKRNKISYEDMMRRK